MQLDYSLKTIEERVACVADYLSELAPHQRTRKVLESAADYILMLTEPGQTKRQRNAEYPCITPNRQITVNKRQISYEQVVSSLEAGEDGIYALINNDKNQLLDHYERFTDEDVETIPGLKDHIDQIDMLKKNLDKATGQTRFAIKRQIIETYQQIYILRASSSKAAVGKSSNQVRTIAKMDIPEDVIMDENDMPQTTSPVSLLVPEHVMFLLCYYHVLKQESYNDLNGDMHWLLIDLEDIIDRIIKDDEPILYRIIVLKVDGLSNEEIRRKIQEEFGVDHNEQYYSTLWRKRIPKMIATQAKKDYIIWFFTNVEYGIWKTCGSCGETKLAHPMFFSRNSSEDTYYSICKDCRTVRAKAYRAKTGKKK